MLPATQVAHKLQRDHEVSVAAFVEELKATSEGMTVSRRGVQQSCLSTSILNRSLGRSRQHREIETVANLAMRAAVSKMQEVEAEIHVEEAKETAESKKQGSDGEEVTCHTRNSNIKQKQQDSVCARKIFSFFKFFLFVAACSMMVARAHT